jgi:hypothetical protein
MRYVVLFASLQRPFSLGRVVPVASGSASKHCSGVAGKHHASARKQKISWLRGQWFGLVAFASQCLAAGVGQGRCVTCASTWPRTQPAGVRLLFQLVASVHTRGQAQRVLVAGASSASGAAAT